MTVSDSGLTAFTANCVRSIDRWTNDEIKLVGESLPLTVYASDAASSARLSSGSPAPLGKDGTARVVLLDGAEDLLDEASVLGPEEARQWLKLAVVRRALETHEYVVFADGATTFERAGGVAYCVEQLAAAAIKAKEIAAAREAEREAKEAEALLKPMSASAARAKVRKYVVGSHLPSPSHTFHRLLRCSASTSRRPVAAAPAPRATRWSCCCRATACATTSPTPRSASSGLASSRSPADPLCTPWKAES